MSVRLLAEQKTAVCSITSLSNGGPGPLSDFQYEV